MRTGVGAAVRAYRSPPTHADGPSPMSTTQPTSAAGVSRIAELLIVDAHTTCAALATYECSVATMEHSMDVLSEKRQ